jgi:hypothetical protein
MLYILPNQILFEIDPKMPEQIGLLPTDLSQGFLLVLLYDQSVICKWGY